MPAPAAAALSQIARMTFDQVRSRPRVGMINPALFRTGSMLLGGVQPVDYPAYIDGICGAISSAWTAWHGAATLVGVIINAVTANGGQVVGPPLTPLILAGGPKDSAKTMKLTNVIANVLGTAFLTTTSTIKVPGLPWYPSFAAVPAPVAPPTPNIPCPLAALIMVRANIGRQVLKMQMLGQLGSPGGDDENLLDAIAATFAQNFDLWIVSTMVTNVLGTGPVPTFAPPYVPVGPVVGGVGTMVPGGFA